MAMRSEDNAVNDEASRRMAEIITHYAESIPEHRASITIVSPAHSLKLVWMARCNCISGGVCLPREMRHFEISRQCSLFEATYPRIVNFVECSVTKDLDQRLVISDNGEVIAALCEVA